MEMGDVIFYALGTAFVAGVSGLFDVGNLFGAGDEDDEGDQQMAHHVPAEAEEVPADLTAEFQSTLAHFLEDESESLIALRDAERAQEEQGAQAGDDDADALAGRPAAEPGHAIGGEMEFFDEDDDENIFHDDEDEDMAQPAEITVYDVTDPAADPARIDDFDRTQEALEIEYVATVDPQTGEMHVPELGVFYDAEADVTEVTLDGAPVAELEGDAGLTPDDIALRAIT
jgi:hypothetical protein